MANTTAPLSDTAVANMAASTLDEKRLESLDDTGSSFGKFVNEQFGYLRDEFLALYPYAFALRYETLPETTAPAFRWNNAYVRPSWAVRILPLTHNGCHNGRSLPYERVGQELHVNKAGGLPIRAVERVTNIALWDPLPARAFGQYIALQAAQRITGKASYVNKAEKALQVATFNAQHVDSLERGTPEDIEEAEIITGRAVI